MPDKQSAANGSGALDKQGSPTRADRLVARHRFLWLFVSLLGFFLALPLLQEWRAAVNREDLAEGVEAFIFVGVLATVVATTSRSRAWKFFSILLGLPAAVLWVVPAPALAIPRHLFAIAFLVYGVVSILRLVLESRQVTLNLLCASLCVYLLLGVTWAMAYSLMAVMIPNAFTFADGADPPSLRMDTGRSAAALYFSFVTLTTLGYGDIVAASPMTRVLAILEAIVGQLYLAVLVARLVGLHIVDATNPSETDGLGGNAR